MNFSDLIAPIEMDVFFAQHWEQKPLHIARGKAEQFQQLLTIQDLDSALSRHTLREVDCRIVKSATMVSVQAATFSAPASMTYVLDPAKTSRLFLDGHTIIFERAHRWHPPLNRLCVDLFDELGIHAQCNVYLTPPQSRGFEPHFDTHDVLILQVSGKKRWRLYESPHALPLSMHAKPLTTSPGEPTHDLVLEPGDALYIPRGLVHDAEATGAASAHITLGLVYYTWYDFIVDKLKLAAQSEVGFRKSLPLPARGPDPSSRLVIQDLLDSLEGWLRDGLVDYTSTDEYRQRRVPEQQMGLLASATQAESPSLSSPSR